MAEERRELTAALSDRNRVQMAEERQSPAEERNSAETAAERDPPPAETAVGRRQRPVRTVTGQDPHLGETVAERDLHPSEAVVTPPFLCLRNLMAAVRRPSVPASELATVRRLWESVLAPVTEPLSVPASEQGTVPPL
jgi:hypothetical protein